MMEKMNLEVSCQSKIIQKAITFQLASYANNEAQMNRVMAS